MSNPREARLPKWAREELGRLRRMIQDAERRADEARLATSPNDTDTLIAPYSRTPIGLPKGERVRFLVNDCWIDVRAERDGVRLIASNRLSIHPEVTNVVVACVEGR